ncbi:mechanosensitive ion channel family protein [Pseudomonas sp. B21-056]|jgi:small-conductance mechanosensitive channel|uniref:mechanosensitive ion channel family protein n=1 Tax=Pseudomonas sp. B21-056 TaxID=2895495 RepID=UPI00223177AE|nr:mechanosensitive ion channel family protein [Pseudomonas sp. B21-056]UZE25750.1 mechanosensitive ion channel family protein [Pseudomonas sp. B21-056]
MATFVQHHPLVCGVILILIDLALWQLIGDSRRNLRMCARVGVFVMFCWVMTAAGISPLQPPLWPDDAILNLMGTVLGIGWWLFAARTLTVLLGNGLLSRVGHNARLLQDLMGAVIFLIGIIGAAAYVLQLPVKGLLATSGAMAIIVGLALQSTLSDMFSGIVLNTTKPYQIDDWISIDGTQGRVVEIDWRSTHLMTDMGGMAVVPNSLAAKARLLNFSRPGDAHGVSVCIAVPSHVRPRRVIEALEKALRGTRALLPAFSAKASVKASHLEYTEYELKGFIASARHKTEVCNLMFDLAHRHLEASGIIWGTGLGTQPWSRQRQLLEDVRIFRSLDNDERERLADDMATVDYQADEVILAFGEIADCLMIISSGVVSVSIHDGEKMIEAGRLGPGEILGEEGILAANPSRGEFRSITSGRLFRIEKAALCQELVHLGELKAALSNLQGQREEIRETVVMQKVVEPKKNRFLQWLKHR